MADKRRHQRRHQRYAARFAVTIDTPSKKGRVGISQNVSASGMLLCTRSRLTVGEPIEVSFVGPDVEPRRVSGRIVRSTDMWESFFPRCIAVAFDRELSVLPSIFPPLPG